MFGAGTATLIISYEEIKYIMKIVKSLEESSLLIKEVSDSLIEINNMIAGSNSITRRKATVNPGGFDE